MMYDFDQLPDRRGSECIKWRCHDQDVLPMWVADMDFVSPEPVIRALRERVAHGVFGYPGEPDGLREAIVEWQARRHGYRAAPEDMLFLPGVVSSLNVAGHAVAAAGEGILIQPPVYMPFLSVPSNAGAVRRESPLTRQPSGAYGIDFDAFERAIVDFQPKAFLLCNPHNPVGRAYTRGELERVAQICLRHRVLIVSDEIHGDIIFSVHKHVPMASLDPEIARHTITLLAPSKTFNISGLGCSVAVIPDPGLRDRFCRAQRGMVPGVNLLGLVAARAAYRDGREWLDQLLPYLQGNRDYLCHFVNDQMPGVAVTQPEGTYLAWLDCRQAGIGERPEEFFLQKARVAVIGGSAFGRVGEGFVRLNFACPRAILVEAMKRMREALKKGP